MPKPIVMSMDEWEDLLEKIKQREKPSVWMSRSKMKESLGFTPRHHTDWTKTNGKYDYDNAHTMRLDFFDEAKRTMFLLKYGNGKN